MKILCISDSHGKHRELKIPDSDWLLYAGDSTSMGTERQFLDFIEWFSNQPHRVKCFINGNHDFLGQDSPLRFKSILEKYPNIIYLEHEAKEIEEIKVFGSPWTPKFGGWAYNADDDQLIDLWDQIPDDTQILVTHGPPYGILDKTAGGQLVGCNHLRYTIQTRLTKLKLHTFGHIHEGAGQMTENGVTYVNASVLDEHYHPNGNIQLVEYDF